MSRETLENSDIYDVDVFDEDFFVEGENEGMKHIGRWGIHILHGLKLAFVIYSGGHNIQASITASGGNILGVVSQIIGVLVLESTIAALYMAGIGGFITGPFQGVVAILFWCIGIALASLGIVADSRMNAGQPLTPLLDWHLSTGLYLAPVIMIVGVALVVFSDPVLFQQIMNAKDRARLKRERVKAVVLAQRAEHQSRKIVQNIRLGTQKQLAKYAKGYYQSEEVQKVLEEMAVQQLADLMRQAGIAIPLPAPNGAGGEREESVPDPKG